MRVSFEYSGKWVLFQFHSSWLCRLWVTDISRGAPIPSTPRIRHWGSLIKLETERQSEGKGRRMKGIEKKGKLSRSCSPLPSPPSSSLFICLFCPPSQRSHAEIRNLLPETELKSRKPFRAWLGLWFTPIKRDLIRQLSLDSMPLVPGLVRTKGMW